MSPATRCSSSSSWREASICATHLEQETARWGQCRRCRASFVVCRRCDHGRWYCGDECRGAARRAAVAEAGRRYRATDRGRRNGARRQRSHRARKRDAVTHQGSPNEADQEVGAALDAVMVAAEPSPTPKGPSNDPAISPVLKASADGSASEQRCGFCGRICSPLVRLGFLPTPIRRTRRRHRPRDRVRARARERPR